MEVADAPYRRKTGRPRSFDRSAALEKAMLCFWQYGYETTSLADLTTAMEVTAPSIYTAFGDKRRLFLEAMRRYAGDPAELEKSLANAPTAREAAHALLTSAAIAFTGEATPKGCLLASATASGSKQSDDVKAAVAEIRGGIAILLADRINRDKSAGILPDSANASALADMILAIVQGMSVLARDGVKRERLLALSNQAMLAWPDPIPAQKPSRLKSRRLTPPEPHP